MAFRGSGAANGFYSTAVPFTGTAGSVFLQVKTGNHGGGARTLFCIGQAASTERIQLQHNDNNAEFSVQTVDGAAATTTCLATVAGSWGSWMNFVGLIRASNDRQAWVQSAKGGQGGGLRTGTITTNVVPVNPWDQFSIGYSKFNGTTGTPLNTRLRLANVFLWDRVLSPTDAAALIAEHVHPLDLRGPKPVYWFPLHGNGICEITGRELTAEGTPQFDQARAPLKRRPKLWVVPRQISALAAPTISSTSDANKLIDESTFVITGTNTGTTTAVTFKQTGRPDYNATAFISANDATTVTLTGLDVQDMSMAYGAATVEITTAGGTSAPFAITIQEKAAHQYITLSGHTPGDGWALGEATANGDQLVAPDTTTLGGTFAFVGTDGSYTITYGGTAPTDDTAYWAWFDDSADQWYESVITINPGAGGMRYKPMQLQLQLRI